MTLPRVLCLMVAILDSSYPENAPSVSTLVDRAQEILDEVEKRGYDIVADSNAELNAEDDE